MADNTVLASSVASIPHIKVLHDIFRDRLDALPIDKVIIYMIDLVDESALVWLAQQLDVLGYKGWFLADTVEQKRAVLKRAIALHKKKGTPWSIKQALLEIGYEAEIEEGVGTLIYYDGSTNHNGSATYGDQGHWAYFRVLINLLNFTVAVPASDVETLRQLILEYKNARSHLYQFGFYANLTDDISADISDSISITVNTTLSDAVAWLYNGTFSYDGSITHTGINDDNDITII